jgi:hypothetical protein
VQRLDRLDVLVNNVGSVLPRRKRYGGRLRGDARAQLPRPVRAHARAAPATRRERPSPDGEHELERTQDVEAQSPPRSPIAGAVRQYQRTRAREAAQPDLDGRARELEATVDAVNPGAAWTPGPAQVTPEAIPFWRPIWPIVRFFQRRASPESAAQTPIWLAADAAVASLSGRSFESKRHRGLPVIASDRVQQRRVIDIATELVASAQRAAAKPDAPRGMGGSQP